MRWLNLHTVATYTYTKTLYVTGFAKTVPIGTTIEIHFMA